MSKVSKKSSLNEVTKELEELQGGSQTITYNGEEIVIKPFTFGKLLKALKYLSVIVEDVEMLTRQNIITLIANNTEQVYGLLELGTGKSQEFFEDELPADVGFDIALAVWDVNQDFFSQKLGPKFQRLAQLGSQSDPKNKEEILETETNPEAQEAVGTT